MRLPRRVCFPFGYTVRIKLVTDQEMLAAQEEEDKEEMVDGFWSVDDKLIRIRKKLSHKRRAYILYHELLHSIHDAMHSLLDEGKAKP
jgi:Zn-dependent peptidase ImmA (M78 family)